MSNFIYTALNEEGKEVKGTVQAENKEEAISKVKAKGITPLKVEAQTAMNSSITLSFLQKKPTPKDMSLFCRQMVSILSAGVSMSEALEMLGEQTENKMLKDAIVGCRMRIEGGSSMNEAMLDFPKVFPDIFVTMIAAGEESGSLEISFTRMAEKFEKDTKMKALVKKSTMYPIVLGIIVVAVIVFMLSFIVPKFQDFLGSLGGSLPPLTQFIVNASDFFKAHYILIILAIVVLVVAFKMFKKTTFGLHLVDKIKLKAPLVGNLTVRTACSNMMRTLSTLISTGISMIDAIDICSDTMTNVYYKEAMASIKSEVAQGTALSEAIEGTKLFPPMVFHMTRIGEETGNLTAMLDRSADYYDQEVQSATEAMTAALEPIIIVVMAGIVGTMVISLLMPMMSMYDSLDSI
ncbi:MAG: type II secretion system F family protein [Clostridiales bacterium]|nr:type II secretion system F family protein [Clostridiales bacterium]